MRVDLNVSLCRKSPNGFARTSQIIILQNEYMDRTPSVVDAAIRGIQEKKGKKIEVVNLQKVNTSVTDCLVICQGNTPSQVSALSNEVWDQVHKLTGEKPLSIDGMRNSEWVAMDYGNVVVHIFLPKQRAYYDLEHLWADAEVEGIADLD